jgi:aspartate aminotransferase-like enzyme
MFNPNCVPGYSHRSDEFKALYRGLKELFRDKFSIDNDYEIIFVTGSGTLANEIVISSFTNKWKTIFHGYCIYYNHMQYFCKDQKFGLRLQSLAEKYNKDDSVCGSVQAVCYETSTGTTIYDDLKSVDSKVVFLDCVSSFPYNVLYKKANVFTTVSGKQLGCAPGVAIIAIKTDVVKYFNIIEDSYLSLNNHLFHAMRNQTPYTPAISLYKDFYNGLKKFDLEKHNSTINERYKLIEGVCGNKIGSPPVSTFESLPQWIAQKYNLYKGANGYQAFLYCGTDKQYKDFAKDLKQCL